MALPIILIETKLYEPHYSKIVKTVLTKKKFKEDEQYYKDYIEVQFAVSMAAGTIDHYVSLPILAVTYANEKFTRQLNQAKCNFNVTDVHSYSLLSVALALAISDDSTEDNNKILNLLLDNKEMDLNVYCELFDQTVLQCLARRGDKYLSIYKKIAARATDYRADHFGANPLTFALQEEQYQTSAVILETEQGQALVHLSREDGCFPLDLVCEYLQDPAKGKAILDKILQWVDVNVYQNAPALYYAMMNNNPECRLLYIKRLLEKGAKVDLKFKDNESLITHCFYLYLRARDANDINNTKSYLAIFKLFLEYNVELIFDLPNDPMSFLQVVCKSKASEILALIHEYSNNHPRLKAALASSAEPNESTHQKNETPSAHKEAIAYSNLLYMANRINDDDHKQRAYFDLIKDCEIDMVYRRILSEIIQMFKRGVLLPENIIKLISLLDKNEDYKEYIPYLYREYLAKLIQAYRFSVSQKDQETILRNLSMFVFKLAKGVKNLSKEDCEYFQYEINDLVNRIIQLTLLATLNNGVRGLDRFIYWIDQIESHFFDEDTQLMILQLKITQAYFSFDAKSFNEYYKILDKQLPPKHLLRRQYDYWRLVLLFRHAELESIDVLKSALNKFDAYNLDKSLVKDFYSALDKHPGNKQIVRPEKKQAYKSPENVSQNNTTIVAKTSDNNSIASASSTVVSNSTVENNNNNSNNKSDPELAPKVKEKTRGVPFAEMLNNAMQALQQRLNPPAALVPIYSEADIRKHYAEILKPCDILKPVSYQNKYGEYWVVCNFEDLKLENYTEKRFRKEFEKSNTIRPGAASGLSLKTTFRLMLGHNDERLHSTLYKNKNNTCSLIRFDELWRHNDPAFEARTVFIEDLVTAAPNKFNYNY